MLPTPIWRGDSFPLELDQLAPLDSAAIRQESTQDDKLAALVSRIEGDGGPV